MKASVDRELCMGDRNCNMVCPEVFQYDEDELMSIVLMDEIPQEYKALVTQAADECPAEAITVEGD
jgi:ferredoxin